MRMNHISVLGLGCFLGVSGCSSTDQGGGDAVNSAGGSATRTLVGGRAGTSSVAPVSPTNVAGQLNSSGGSAAASGADAKVKPAGSGGDAVRAGSSSTSIAAGGNSIVSVATSASGAGYGEAGRGIVPSAGGRVATTGGAPTLGGAPTSAGAAISNGGITAVIGIAGAGGVVLPTTGGSAPSGGGQSGSAAGGQPSAGGTTQAPECTVAGDCRAPGSGLDQCHQLACNSGKCEAVAKTNAACTSPLGRSGLCSSGGICAVCTGDTYMCENDNLYHCPSTQIDYELAGRCGPGLCNASGHKCNGCIAGSSWCDPNDSTKTITCGSDGQTQTTTTKPGQYCSSSGSTTKWVDCLQDAQCPDVSLPACTVKACGSDNKCTTKSSLLGTTCSGGTCDGAGKCLVCAADQYQCSGTTLQHCKTDRTGWDTAATCTSAALCDASAKQCLKCEKSKVWCSDINTKQACSADGLTQTTTTKPSNSTPYCTGAGNWVACLSNDHCVQPANPCQQVTCSSTNVCSSASNKPANSACAGNGTCDAAGTCIGPAATSCSTALTCQGRSCCESRLVVGGTFPMGRGSSTDACPTGAGFTCNSQGYETPEHNATVSSYYLDTFEVTVGRFRKFLSSFSRTMTASGAGANAHVAASNPSYSSTGWDASWNSALPADSTTFGSNIQACTNTTWPTSAGGEANENRAVNCVTWYDAFAFCAWDGGRLPTAAEWEYAAAGGSNNYLYPWGSAVTDGTHCNCAGNDSRSLTMIVGGFPAGAGVFGQRDLAGSFEEWMLDWAASDWYNGSGSTCNNCVDLRAATLRITRGGSYAGTGSSATFLRAAAVNGYTPATRDYRVGFRCARDPR